MKKNEIDMLHGPLAGSILLFTVPLMLSNILQLLFNAADVIIVGRFAGDTSLAAVGSTSSLISLITALFVGLSVGANVVAATEMGRGHKKSVELVVQTSITASFVSGGILLLFGVLFSGVLLRWMGTPEDVLLLATQYLRIYFMGMPALMAYNFGSALLRAKGDTRRPLYYLAIAGVVNVVLNCILVIFFAMGVAGVAIATVVSQAISAILVLRCLCREEGMLHLTWGRFYIHRAVFYRILRIGLPAGLQGVLFSFSNVLIQAGINSFGSDVIAGNAAAVNIGNFAYMALNAFNQTAISFNGQNTGAGRYDRVDRITALCMVYVTVLGIIFSVGITAFGPRLLGIYTTSAAVIAAGMVRMRWYMLPFFLCNIMDVLPGCIRGMGYSVLPMIVSLLGSCALRVIWIYTIFAVYHTEWVLYLSYPVTWIVTISAHVVCYFYLRKKLRESHQTYRVKK